MRLEGGEAGESDCPTFMSESSKLFPLLNRRPCNKKRRNQRTNLCIIVREKWTISKIKVNKKDKFRFFRNKVEKTWVN